MVHEGDLVIIGISVGLAVGILIASPVFFGICWYKKRAHLGRCANDRSASTLPIRTNGLDTSIDSSASLSSSVAMKGPGYPAQKPQHSWWNNHSKDRFASASSIPRYSYNWWMLHDEVFLCNLLHRRSKYCPRIVSDCSIGTKERELQEKLLLKHSIAVDSYERKSGVIVNL